MSKNQEYKDSNYDRLAILVRKGKRDEYKAAASDLGLGYAEMIRSAVEEYIQRHRGEVVIPATAKVAAEKISADERRLLDAAAKFPQDTRKLFLKLVEDLAAKLESKSDGNVG